MNVRLGYFLIAIIAGGFVLLSGVPIVWHP